MTTDRDRRGSRGPRRMLSDVGAGLRLIDTKVQSAAAPSIGLESTPSHSRHELAVTAPFRLDLTVSALRRLSTNIVDVLTSDGQYIRAFETSRAPVVARVTQVNPGG